MNWVQRNFREDNLCCVLGSNLGSCRCFNFSRNHLVWDIKSFSWAIYLSIGIEIAALSAVAAISAKMGKKVYIPFGIVTLNSIHW